MRTQKSSNIKLDAEKACFIRIEDNVLVTAEEKEVLIILVKKLVQI